VPFLDDIFLVGQRLFQQFEGQSSNTAVPNSSSDNPNSTGDISSSEVEPSSDPLLRFVDRYVEAFVASSEATASASEEIARLWEPLLVVGENPSATPVLFREKVEPFLAYYRTLNPALQTYYRPLALLAWANLRLLEGDPDGVLSFLQSQQREHSELAQVQPISTISAQLQQRRRILAAQHIYHLGRAVVMIDMEERFALTRFLDRSGIENRFNAWAQHFQQEVEGGEETLAAFERLKSEFIGISDQIGPIMNREHLWENVGYIATQQDVAQMDSRVFEIATRWRQPLPYAATSLYQSLIGSSYNQEAREAQARLGGEVRRFLRNLTPWTAESNRAFARNLFTVGSFAVGGWVSKKVGGFVAARLGALLLPRVMSVGSLFAANAAIRGTSWAAGTLTSATTLPFLSHGGDPIVQGTYGQEFSHNLMFLGFLNGAGLWTNILSNPASRAVTGWLTAVGGMAVYDLSTNPEMRNEHPLELAGYFFAQDALGRAGHALGEHTPNLVRDTLFNEAWQNRVGASLEELTQRVSTQESSRRWATVAAGVLAYLGARTLGWEQGAESLGLGLGFLMGTTASIPEAPSGMIYLPGGEFVMGTHDPDPSFNNARPVRWVRLDPYFMSRTHVTTA